MKWHELSWPGMDGSRKSPDITVLCALEIERRWLQRFADGSWQRAHCCGPGAGAMLAWLASRRPKALIVAGLAGSLNPNIRAGSAWVVNEVVDSRSGERRRAALPASFLQRACAIVSVDGIVSSRSQRQQHRDSTGADLVDMESAAAARWATDARIPWAIVRGVSDDPQTTSLPAESARWVDDRGRTRLGLVATAALRRPGLIRELLALRRASRTAMKEAAELVGMLVEQWDQHSAST